MRITPVILAGGSGTRLWPLSRDQHPKQFLSLNENSSLLQQTVTRLEGLPNLAPVLVIGREDHRFLVAEHLRRAGQHDARIVLEPMGRNTAPAVALAAFLLQSESVDDANDLMLVLPSDHVIGDNPAFHQAVETAATAACQGQLATFGIDATYAETGYGYIQAGNEIAADTFRVERFVEKPDLHTARDYLAQGCYYWNSGMFLFSASQYLAALAEQAPDIHAATRQAMNDVQADGDFIRPNPEAFAACRAESIDYAVMEKSDHRAVIPLLAGWSDLGSWSSVADIRADDDASNQVHGDTLALDTHNSLLWSEGRLVAALGLEDAIIIETADAVLVTQKGREQDIKTLVQALKDQGRDLVSSHTRVYRPWGSYETITLAPRFQVKRIIVKPGCRLSLQKHQHRAEHWVVVTGTARVTRGEDVFDLREDQSTYIPLGEKHRLENPGTSELEIIEIQSGDYLGEDDIVRFEDAYGRVPHTDSQET